MSGKLKAPKTGKVKAREGFKTKEGKETYSLLADMLKGFEESPEAKALSEAGTELLLRDTLARNLGIADTMSANEIITQNRDLGRSLLSRGVSDSGFASSQMLASNNDIRSRFFNDAVVRSSQEEIAGKQTGMQLLQSLLGTKSNFADLLAGFTSSVLGAGIAGKASAYNAKVGYKGAVDSAMIGAAGDTAAAVAGGGEVPK